MFIATVKLLAEFYNNRWGSVTVLIFFVSAVNVSEAATKPCDDVLSESYVYIGEEHAYSPNEYTGFIKSVILRGEIIRFSVRDGKFGESLYNKERKRVGWFTFDYSIAIFEEYQGKCHTNMRRSGDALKDERDIKHARVPRYLKHWKDTPHKVAVEGVSYCPSCKIRVTALNPETGESVVAIDKNMDIGLDRWAAPIESLKRAISSDNFRTKPRLIQFDFTFTPTRYVKAKDITINSYTEIV